MATRKIRCSNCGKEYWKPEHAIGERNFCTKECHYEYRLKHPECYNHRSNEMYKKLLKFAEMRRKGDRI